MTPPLPKFPFVLPICGVPFTVDRRHVSDGYGESSYMDREILIGVSNDPDWPVPDHQVWPTIAHETFHMILAITGKVNEDNELGLSESEEESLCIISELLWLALAPVALAARGDAVDR